MGEKDVILRLLSDRTQWCLQYREIRYREMYNPHVANICLEMHIYLAVCTVKYNV